MTTTELYNEVMGQLTVLEIHPLHKAMLEECCESALKNNQGVTENDILVSAVNLAFITCNSTLKATLQSALDAANADHVTLNYREQTFIIESNSSLLK